MKKLILKGATSQIWYLKIRHASTGAGLPGLAFNTSGLTCYYVRDGAAPVEVTLVTQTTTGSYSSGGFVEVSSANMPGIYRFDPPNAALASGSEGAVFTFKGAANMDQVDIEVELIAVNLQDAVRAGLTSLPNANSGTAGGVITAGTGTAVERDCRESAGRCKRHFWGYSCCG